MNNFFEDIFRRKDGKLRKRIKCPSCKKHTMKLYFVTSKKYISGNLYYYECKCGYEGDIIL